MIRVKICGLTRPQDALEAEAAGADAVGMIFVPNTKRFVGLDQARALVAGLGPLIARVGVFRDASLDTIVQTIEAVGLGAVQLHNADDGFAQAVARVRPVLRVVKPEAGLPTEIPPNQTLMIDGPDPGSGHQADWVRLRSQLGRSQPQRWILAGGLKAENVAQAIQDLKPWGVDASSGTEMAGQAGIKNPEKIWAFVRAARHQPT